MFTNTLFVLRWLEAWRGPGHSTILECAITLRIQYETDQRRIKALEEGLRQAIDSSDSWTHDQLDGTRSLESALAELDSVRALIDNEEEQV